MRSFAVALTVLLASFGFADAEQVVLSDGDFPDSSWTIDGDGVTQFTVGSAPDDGNPGAYRRLEISEGAGGQITLVNTSPAFLYDPATHGAITGLSIAFDAIRLDVDDDNNPQYISVGIVQNETYSQSFSGLAGIGWQHYEFECIVLDDLELDGGPVQFAFAFAGYSPFGPLGPHYVIGIDNFVVQIQTAPDTCDGLGPVLALEGTDNGHEWGTDSVIPYIITVTNDGGAPLSAVQLSEHVPVKATFVPDQSTGDWTCGTDGICSASVGDLGPGESKSLTFAAQVTEGTPPAWVVYNEIEASGGAVATVRPEATNGSSCKTVCTSSATSSQDEVCSIKDPVAFAVCCALNMLCKIDPEPGLCVLACGSGCSGTTSNPSPVQPAGSDESIRFERLYRLRDRVFHGRAGGERATELYYQHSFALGTAFVNDPALVEPAFDTLRLWQPAIDSLLAGTPDTVTPERLQALQSFLDALRPASSPLLAAAIDHGRRRLDLDTWEGISLTDALARLDQLVCVVGATYPSVVCRLEDADEIAIADVPAGKLATKITTSLGRAITEATEAAATDEARLARRHTRRAGKLARKVTKRVKSRSGRKTIPEATRTELTALLDAVRVDLKTLAH